MRPCKHEKNAVIEYFSKIILQMKDNGIDLLLRQTDISANT